MNNLILQETVFQKFNTLASQAHSSTVLAAGVVATIFFLLISASARFKASTTIITFLICSGVVWAVANMDVGSRTVGDTINTQPSAGASNQP